MRYSLHGSDSMMVDDTNIVIVADIALENTHYLGWQMRDLTKGRMLPMWLIDRCAILEWLRLPTEV